MPDAVSAKPHRVIPPTMTRIAYDPPRPLTDWVVLGEIVEGCEANGRALRYDAIEELNRAAKTGQPCQYVVVGERRYGDGRFTLDLAVSPAWIRAMTDWRPIDGRLVWICPDCEGHGDTHRKVSVQRLDGSKVEVWCPRRETSGIRR